MVITEEENRRLLRQNLLVKKVTYFSPHVSCVVGTGIDANQEYFYSTLKVSFSVAYSVMSNGQML